MPFTLTGTLDARPDPAPVRAALDAHIAATRAEPGCLSFDVWEDPQTPGLFHVHEVFATAEAFAAHQTRTQASPWWDATRAFPRAYQTDDDPE